MPPCCAAGMPMLTGVPITNDMHIGPDVLIAHAMPVATAP